MHRVCRTGGLVIIHPPLPVSVYTHPSLRVMHTLCHLTGREGCPRRTSAIAQLLVKVHTPPLVKGYAIPYTVLYIDIPLRYTRQPLPAILSALHVRRILQRGVACACSMMQAGADHQAWDNAAAVNPLQDTTVKLVGRFCFRVYWNTHAMHHYLTPSSWGVALVFGFIGIRVICRYVRYICIMYLQTNGIYGTAGG